jgi:hypothetical protein
MIQLSASDIGFSNRYRLTGLNRSTENGEAVVHEQLTDLNQDILNVVQSLSNYIPTQQFASLFGTASQNANLFNGSQVDAAIAAALAGIPAAESRLVAVAVKDVVIGTLADAVAALPTLGLVANDSLYHGDVYNSGILVLSDVNGSSMDILQLGTDGQLRSIKAGLLTDNINLTTEIRIVASPTRRGRTFAVIGLDGNTITACEIPYTDEWTSGNNSPLVFNQSNKTASFSYSALDFVVSQDGKFELVQAYRDAIAEVPELVTDLAALEQAVDTLNTTLSNQITALTGRVQTLEQTTFVQDSNISTLQGQMGDALARLLQLETQAVRVSDLAKTLQIKFAAANNSVVAYTEENGTWSIASAQLVQTVNATANHIIVRIAHNRGIPARPIYSRSNAQNEMLNSTDLYAVDAIDAESIVMHVENWTDSMVTFPAGLTAQAFA